MTRIIAVVGTIPGAGATTTVAALGTALGEQRQRVAVLDATAEGSRVADVLEVEDAGDLADALRRGTAVPDVQGSGPHDVAAFPAAPETGWGSMRPDAVATLYDELRERFEFVLVDCGSDLSPARTAWLGHADEAVIVTDPDVAGAVPETTALAGAFEVPVRGAIANRVPPKEVEDAVDALGRTDVPVLGVLPEDPTVGAAADAGDSVLRTEPDSLVATVAWELALRFRHRDHDEPVVPLGTGPPPTTETGESAPEDDGSTADAGGPGPEGDATGAQPTVADDSSDEPSPVADDATGEQPPVADDATDDRREESDSASASPTAEPVPPADDASASPGGVTGAVDSEPGDRAASAVPDDPRASTADDDGDHTGTSGSDGPEIAPDEDPFTSPEPRAVEDDETETNDDETGTIDHDRGTVDEEGGASGADPQGSLLGDVRAHIEDRHPEGEAPRPGLVDDPGPETETDVGTDDPEPAGSADGPGPNAGADGPEPNAGADAPEPNVGTDAPEPNAGTDAPEPNAGTDAPGSGAGEGDDPDDASVTDAERESAENGTDDGAAELSDEEIESLFAETMERVQGRRDSESGGAEDGAARENEEDE